MAFDGITIHCLAEELRRELLQMKINKIAQPEKEELLLTFKGKDGIKRLHACANASLPFLYLTKENKPSPATAPNFCMLLRKHVGSGRIVEITQPDTERVICFTIEHLDDLGDIARKYLYVELMGKHSNIIFCNQDNIILDSIKHVSSQISSVREVLPGREYFIPRQEGKLPFVDMDEALFSEHVLNRPLPAAKAIYSALIGVSPVIAQELVYRSRLSQEASAAALTTEEKHTLYLQFRDLAKAVQDNRFSPQIIYEKNGGQPLEFSPISLTMYAGENVVSHTSISEVLQLFYAQRNRFTVMHQKSADLRKTITNCLERNRKKYSLQQKQLSDTAKKEKFRLYGELLHTYGYTIPAGAGKAQVTNYYDGNDITIPLDAQLSAMDNASVYFEKYNKLKRTEEALTAYIQETKEAIDHLESVESALSLAEDEADLNAIKEELSEYGFIKKRTFYKNKKAKNFKSHPLHFVDGNGYHMYVGKNNYQNDELTFKFATGNDWWFHAKKIHGSHVIVKSQGTQLPDETFEAAAALAAYYSSGRNSSKVEIDYLQKKYVKKPNKAVPGFVIYYTNYSMTVTPGISALTRLSD